MDHCPFQPLESPKRASRAAAMSDALGEAPTRKEGQPCSHAAIVCSTEVRLRSNNQPAVGATHFRRAPLDASRCQPRSLTGDARQIEPGRTHRPALCDAHPPTQAPNPALRLVHAARGASRPCAGPRWAVRAIRRRSAANRCSAAEGTPLASPQRSKEQERPQRQGAPPSAALLGSQRCPVPRHARRLHGGAHPVADAHGGAGDSARVRAVRARSHSASATRPETATATQPQACISA